MKISSFHLILLAFAILGVSGQATTNYTDTKTGISGGYIQFGSFSVLYAIPSDLVAYPNELILQITGARSALSNGGGWAGVALAGGMTSSLLLVAYVDGDTGTASTTVKTTFRIAPGYVAPNAYTQNTASIQELNQFTNATHFQITVRCMKCTSWNQDGVVNSIDLSSNSFIGGWGMASTSVPANAASLQQHDIGFGNYGVNYAQIRQFGGSRYANYVQGASTASPTATSRISSSPSPTAVQASTPTGTYDYIIIGGGAGGQVMSHRLSESGKYSVLLLERGPPSTYAHGGRDGPAWVQENALTRFDVPGLCNEIWHNASYIACPDYDSMAGCVLGGGTAINAGLFWKPPKQDFDNNFPAGWKSADMTEAINRVFNLIPSTDRSSMDGKQYLPEIYNLIGPALTKAGWSSAIANSSPNAKNKTFVRPPFMFINGERGGPLATYMLTARKKTNFQVWFNTMAERVTRNGATVTGIDIIAQAMGGYTGNVKLNPGGRVIVAAGSFGSPKLLLRSGIGPLDMLQVVAASADAPKMIPKSDWIYLPVGYNLMDHTNTDMVFEHDSIVPYDFYAAWNAPIAGDKTAYLSSRSGTLATAAPGISIAFHEVINGIDGKTRSVQWTARDEGSLDFSIGKFVTLSQYLGNGFTSRGRLGISSFLNTQVILKPYAQNEEDIQAIIDGIVHVYDALSAVPGLRWMAPPPNQTYIQLSQYVRSYTAGRGTNHWMGSNKMGIDDGRNFNGRAGCVVDLNAKVYGMNNLFVVDSSIFPGMPTTNPTAIILTVAEQAAMKILALAGGPSGSVTNTASNTASRTSTSPSPAVSSSTVCALKYAQCAGTGYTGLTNCCSGSTCQYSNPFYSQCL